MVEIDLEAKSPLEKVLCDEYLNQLLLDLQTSAQLKNTSPSSHLNREIAIAMLFAVCNDYQIPVPTLVINPEELTSIINSSIDQRVQPAFDRVNSFVNKRYPNL